MGHTAPRYLCICCRAACHSVDIVRNVSFMLFVFVACAHCCCTSQSVNFADWCCCAIAAVCLSLVQQIGNVKKWMTSADDVSDHVTLSHKSIAAIVFSTVRAQRSCTSSFVALLPVLTFFLLCVSCVALSSTVSELTAKYRELTKSIPLCCLHLA
jgi:hypothetical protein